MIQRNGCMIIRMLDNVQRKTIEPLIRKYVKAGSKVFTDEYNIYNWLSSTYTHKTVNHGKGEYARDDNETVNMKYTLIRWKASGHY